MTAPLSREQSTFECLPRGEAYGPSRSIGHRVSLCEISMRDQPLHSGGGDAITRSELVCLEKPDRRFPFDIQHRKIITYKTESARDFEDLKTKITDGLKAWIRKEGSLGKLEPAPIESLAETSVVAEVAELDFLKRTALTTLASHFDGHGSTTTFFEIKSDILGHEFKAEEVTVAMNSRQKKSRLP